ncbi:MAG: hypothetical protein KDB62_07690 [Solirubrobacterales bacterium]|nr:hypothetical protein [Solirubrobacterales bacterium]
MDEDAPPQPVPQREDLDRVDRGDPVDRAAQPGVERQVAMGLEHQRVEVQHAELAVTDPRPALRQGLERADVDEDRARASELHVVRRGVLQRQALFDRRDAEVELEQGRVAKHREGPLVRVRDERDPLVPEHPFDPGRQQATRLGR